MNGAAKFDTFKQSFASIAKNSQTKLIQQMPPSQTYQGSIANTNYNNNLSGSYGSYQYNPNINNNITNPNSNVITNPNSNLNNNLINNLNSNLISNINNNINNNNFNSTFNPNSLPMPISPSQSQVENSRGAIRSALKFDYQLGTMKIKSSDMREIVNKPSANIFSCMDNPNYQRDFQITPKVIRR